MFLERQHFGMRLPDIFQITTHLLKTTLHDSKGRGFSTELNHKNSTQPLKLKQIVLNFETEMLETPSPALKGKKKKKKTLVPCSVSC